MTSNKSLLNYTNQEVHLLGFSTDAAILAYQIYTQKKNQKKTPTEKHPPTHTKKMQASQASLLLCAGD